MEWAPRIPPIAHVAACVGGDQYDLSIMYPGNTQRRGYSLSGLAQFLYLICGKAMAVLSEPLQLDTTKTAPGKLTMLIPLVPGVTM